MIMEVNVEEAGEDMMEQAFDEVTGEELDVKGVKAQMAVGSERYAVLEAVALAPGHRPDRKHLIAALAALLSGRPRHGRESFTARCAAQAPHAKHQQRPRK